MRNQRTPEKNPTVIPPKLSKELRQLQCRSWRAGRIKGGSNWDLDSSCKLVDESDEDSKDESLASEGSRITSTEETSIVLDVTSTSRRSSSCDIALEETPPEKRSTRRKPPDDCHVIIRWSELSNLIKKNMFCSGCGNTNFELTRRTIGIATEINFSCKCRKSYTAYADRTNYMEEKSDHDFIRRERRVDNYVLNWRLLMATQLLGESQVGGSIIRLFLDLTREAFRNAWAPMEGALGVEQRKIGKEVVDTNLNQETMGKEAVLCEDGKLRYPVHVSYDTGWQKSSKTYDSLSGHGLMIGSQTKRVVCFQNYSKTCGKCEIHSKRIATNKIPADSPVKEHHCPQNHDGSSKGMETKAALECIHKCWSHEEISAFIEVVCIDDDATTKAYLCHCFFDLLDAKGLPRPTNLKGNQNQVPGTTRANFSGTTQL